MEHYGVVGTGTAPKKVIDASLNDIGTKVTYYIPWYGSTPVPEGLETVYDWMLDNEAKFTIIASAGSKAVPKVLAKKALEVVEADDVDLSIINELKTSKGLTTVLWSDDDFNYSVNLASTSINLGLPTLELTNGLTPIILESDTPAVVEVTAEKVDEMEELDITTFDRETLEIMPAAHVKRLARHAGHEVRTKDEAIQALLQKEDDTSVPELPVGIATIDINFDNGNQITYRLDKAMLAKIHQVLVAEFTE